MRRSVTIIRTCVSALVLLLSVLLAVDCAEARPAPPGGTEVATGTASAPVADETEHGADDCHPRRTVRHQQTPPAPGERPLHAGGRQARSLAADFPAALPGNGSAGMPWRRSVEVPVLHQVLRH
ncbi:hypothetical protein [Streptomyces sp. 891-h]|uniref:hypothetical protein n=1 Tax=Streptomyces sp. 891-h TaxID=2720714 RepID=UPI001FAA89EF|nr:hypothetical protein [Streptomyces sp. 891-h]UNZ20191.1 hypothetical protein HC362_27210 [Streptomyces sp. 891-h]